MLVKSTVTTQKSEVILDATYVAQRVMENIFNESQNGVNHIPIPKEGVEEEWDLPGKKYWIHKEIISVKNNLVSVIVKIYSDETKSLLEAQMETKLLWK